MTWRQMVAICLLAAISFVAVVYVGAVAVTLAATHLRYTAYILAGCVLAAVLVKAWRELVKTEQAEAARRAEYKRSANKLLALKALRRREAR